MKIYIAGHNGMVGASVKRLLEAKNTDNLLYRSKADLDLTDQNQVKEFFQTEKPDVVILAAAKVGGMRANDTYPADYIYDNIMIASNVIHQSYKSEIKKLLFLGSSCLYPKLSEDPISEDQLLNGKLESTNEAYAIAKIAGIKLCESYNRQYNTDFRSIMPTNLYGPKDNFHNLNSHVLPALIRRFHEAVESKSNIVEIWGSGTVRREFLFVDDLASGALKILDLSKQEYSDITEPMTSHINIGTGKDISIIDLAKTIAEITGFIGEITLDKSKPDGVSSKLLNISIMQSLNWTASTTLKQGLINTYNWFLENIDSFKNK